MTETNALSTGSDNLAQTRRLATTSVCYSLPLYRIYLLLLTPSLTAASGAFLQYGSTRLFDLQLNLTLTVGVTNQKVYCVQATGPVPTSIEWYNPQGQLVSRNSGDVVNQRAAAGGRIAYLNFNSYQQSQGGKYECRVASPGNNSETLPVRIGGCHV